MYLMIQTMATTNEHTHLSREPGKYGKCNKEKKERKWITIQKYKMKLGTKQKLLCQFRETKNFLESDGMHVMLSEKPMLR